MGTTDAARWYVTDRVCLRGCMVPAVHYASCAAFGTGTGSCTGCVPVEAREKAMICQRCYDRLRRMVDATADVVAHLRSIADPMKAQVYDRVMVDGSRPELPAPVAAVIIDGSDSIARSVRKVAEFVYGIPLRERGLPPGCAADVAWSRVDDDTAAILTVFDWLVNRSEIADIAEIFLERHKGDPAEWAWWSVADAEARWPLDDRARWAQTPCPECETRTVRVQPPRRRGAPTRFACTTCDWQGDDRDEFYAEAFAEIIPEVVA